MRTYHVAWLMFLLCFADIGCQPNLQQQSGTAQTESVAAPTTDVKASAAPTTMPVLASQSGGLVLSLMQDTHRLKFAVSLKNEPAIEPSPLVFMLDDVDLTDDVELIKSEPYRVHEQYPWVGIHSLAIDNCRGERLTLRHKTGTQYTLDIRAYDDAIAFRIVVPDAGHPRIPDEATTFTLPAGSVGWFHGLGGHYEGEYARREIDKVLAGDWLAPPATFKLPGKSGYVSITEADLKNYAGMALQADGHRGFTTALGHRQPIASSFRMRYRASEGRRLSVPAAIDGEIVTPWRVMIVASDLDGLVNSDVVHNLCPPPDKAIFPQGVATDWVKPGRAVWRYLDGGDASIESTKQFFDGASELGFEYQVVEGMWRRWSDEDLKSVVDYGKERHVGMFGWAHSKDLHDPKAREALYERCHKAGIVGLKIDFFDHEAKELIDLYETLLRETAEQHLLVNFHGANKPTGQSRTWPNELNREAIRGMESSRMTARAFHDTTLPFTRFLAGPADYTPVLFSSRKGDTTWAHQVASAVTLTAPLLTYAASPNHILENPCSEMIKSIPCTWDETVVLPASEIGECAAIARRHGETWFLAVTNGPAPRPVKISLGFLEEADCHAMIVSDSSDGDAGKVQVTETAIRSRESLTLNLQAGGGYLARYTKFRPDEPPVPASSAKPSTNATTE